MNEQLYKLINQYVTYGATMLLGLVVILIIKPVFTPCCTAMIMAYLLNPLVNKLQKLRLSRQFSVFIILLFSVCTIATFFIIFIPTAYSQLLSLTKFLIEKIPLIHKDNITAFLQKYNIIDYEEITKAIKSPESSLENLLSYENIKPLISIFAGLIKNIDNILFSAINSSISISYTISITLITPILLFYILCNWPSIVKQANALIPIKHQETVKSYT